MARFKGRNAVACRLCHSHKAKCSGDPPCRRCQTRGRDCVYPTKDRTVAVPESYLRQLKQQALCTASVETNGPSGSAASSERPRETSRIQKDCSIEMFVEQVKELSREDCPASELSSPDTWKNYTYAKLDFDVLHPWVSIRLPPLPYAKYLLGVFEEGYCDYHWYLRTEFRDRMERTYHNPESQVGNRSWLCRLSVVFALAEAWSRGRESNECIRPASYMTSPYIPLQNEHALQSPAGSELFEQGLRLLKVNPEDPKLGDIEALNLITFYSYCLNRRRTAYHFSRRSVALVSLLELDSSGDWHESSNQITATESEHKVRVWWTTYCMDLMVSLNLGCSPLSNVDRYNIRLPDSDHLAATERENFFDPSLLISQVQLVRLKYAVIHSRTPVHSDDGEQIASVANCLQTWKDALPAKLALPHESTSTIMPESPFVRILASLSLRYNQCWILLTRSLFIRLLDSALRKRKNSGLASPETDITDAEYTFVDRCDCAARTNCDIMVDLWRIGKIAKFGYWEANHLFSALSILTLTRCDIWGFLDRPGLFESLSAGLKTSANLDLGRALLDEMAQIGNPAAQDYQRMLADIDSISKQLTVHHDQNQENLDVDVQFDTILDFDWLKFPWELETARFNTNYDLFVDYT